MFSVWAESCTYMLSLTDCSQSEGVQDFGCRQGLKTDHVILKAFIKQKKKIIFKDP